MGVAFDFIRVHSRKFAAEFLGFCQGRGEGLMRAMSITSSVFV